MKCSFLSWMVVVTVTGIVCPAVTVAGDRALARTTCRECDEVVSRVLALLPERPEAVVVIDVDRSSRSLQQRLENVEGFVTVGTRTVCLKKQAVTFQLAMNRGGIWDYPLAAIVWHEMAHIAGADETEARLRQEDLWRQFIKSRRVETGAGLRYLRALRKRHLDETRVVDARH